MNSTASRTLQLARTPLGTGTKQALFAMRGFLLLLAMAMPLHLPFAMPTAEQAKFHGWEVAPLAGQDDRVLVTQSGWGPQLADLQAGDVVLEIEGQPATPGQVQALREAAEPGAALEMVVLREGETRSVTVVVQEGSWGYAAYQWYRVALAVVAWLVGFALLIGPGGRLDNVVLSAALLLLAPVMLVIDLPIAGILPDTANYLWQMQAAAYRSFFPALLLCFLALQTSQPKFLVSPALWATVFAGLLLTLGLTTDGFTHPLAWSGQGFQRDLRTWLGLVFEILALGGVLLARRRFSSFPNVMRWLAFAILVLLTVGAPLSLVILFVGDRVWLVELIRQLKTLALALFVVTAALHSLASWNTGAGVWDRHRHLARYGSALLLALYSFAVAGTGLIVHGSLDPEMDDAEWLLFLAIFAAVILFSPVFRWTQELVERRVFGHWVQLETESKVLLKHVASELRPDRIAAILAQELPALLGVANASLVVSQELADRWSGQDVGPVDAAPIEAMGRSAELNPRSVAVPVRGTDGRCIAEIRLGLSATKPRLETPELSVLDTIAQGVASALRIGDTHLELQGALRELADSDRIAALGALVGGLAHEVKNPLASLKMGLYLLEQEGGRTEKFTRIERDVRRIDDLMSSLLRFAQQGEKPAPSKVDVQSVARQCVHDLSPVAEDRDVEIVERYEDSGQTQINGGDGEVRIIVSNLLSNALDAADPGSAVEISVARQGDWIELAVCDSGAGIPERRQGTIFDFGFSTKPGGTGLGLALARWEAERLGGTMVAELREPCGTMLLVSLPATTVSTDARPSTVEGAALSRDRGPSRP